MVQFILDTCYSDHFWSLKKIGKDPKVFWDPKKWQNWYKICLLLLFYIETGHKIVIISVFSPLQRLSFIVL